MQIDSKRLWQRLEELAKFTDPERPWTRRAFTERFLQGRDWLQAEMIAAGLETHVDAAGNLIGRLPSRNTELPPVATGSHTDTVPDGGRYDGMLGVLAGLEALQSIREQGIVTDHPLEVIDFLSEEPSDYGLSCIGSRAMAGALEPRMLAYENGAGESLAVGLQRMGGDPNRLHAPLRKPGDMTAFVELHIEQGRVLESREVPIGVVTHIVGIRRFLVTVTGRADHAGTTPMALRRDALVGASQVITEVNRAARAQASQDAYLVATVGRIDVAPNAANAVPETARLVLEVRSDSQDVLDGFLEPLIANGREELAEQGLGLEVSDLSTGSPTACTDWVQDEIEAAAGESGHRALRMPSGAGHDAVYVARFASMGMIFTPCHEGRSHTPEESMAAEQAAAGAEVLASALLRLDRRGNAA